MVGFLITSTRYSPVHANQYMKTYALLEEMGLPIAFHGSYHWHDQAQGMLNRFISVHALGFVWYNMVPSRQLDHQRHPRALSQAQGDVARKRARLDPVHDAALRQRIHDAHVGGACAQEAAVRLHARHVFRLAADGDDRHGRCSKTTMRVINAETQLLYSSDYPHWDFDLPSTIYDLPFLSETAKRNILGGNANPPVQSQARRGEARAGGVKLAARRRSEKPLNRKPAKSTPVQVFGRRE